MVREKFVEDSDKQQWYLKHPRKMPKCRQLFISHQFLVMGNWKYIPGSH